MAAEREDVSTRLRDQGNEDSSRGEGSSYSSRPIKDTANKEAASYVGPPSRLPKGQYTNEEIENVVQPVGYEERPAVLYRGDTKELVKEVDPLGKNPHDAGAKLDAGKSPVLRGCVQYFPRALAEVANISQFGATKYKWKGWESVPDGVNRYGDAMMRHLIKETYEEYDTDSGFLHAAQAAWNALARLELILREKQK